jgi:lipid A 3-O-deacylase
MRRTIVAALVLAAAALLSSRAAVAQTPHSITLRVDNDAFNFWTMPWERPDGEYTSGVHITYDGGGAPRWSRWFARGRSACVVGALDCHTGRAELGQDIYTPLSRGESPPAAGSRPNAGWLYLSQSARVLSPTRSDEVSMTLGVTGPPSLARFTQRLAHSAAPEFNRPVDWSRQIGFEPGAIVRYEQRRRVIAGGGVIGFDVIPSGGFSVGNVSTAADVGVQSRLGWQLRHPWLPQSERAEVALVGGVSGRAIARDIFLDGNTFRPELRVGHRPVVASGEVGVQLRYRGIRLAYRTVATSRAYAAAPRWHPWSSMVGGVTFVR